MALVVEGEREWLAIAGIVEDRDGGHGGNEGRRELQGLGLVARRG